MKITAVFVLLLDAIHANIYAAAKKTIVFQQQS
jgi:hypothetical protein